MDMAIQIAQVARNIRMEVSEAWVTSNRDYGHSRLINTVRIPYIPAPVRSRSSRYIARLRILDLGILGYLAI